MSLWQYFPTLSSPIYIDDDDKVQLLQSHMQSCRRIKVCLRLERAFKPNCIVINAWLHFSMFAQIFVVPGFSGCDTISSTSPHLEQCWCARVDNPQWIRCHLHLFYLETNICLWMNTIDNRCILVEVQSVHNVPKILWTDYSSWS